MGRANEEEKTHEGEESADAEQEEKSGEAQYSTRNV